MVRGKFCGAKGAAQFKKPVQTGTRGSGSPLSLVSYGIKHETDGKMFGITPWRCFFTLYQLNYISRSLQKKNLWGLSTAPLQAEAFHSAVPVPPRLSPAFRPGIQTASPLPRLFGIKTAIELHLTVSIFMFFTKAAKIICV